MPHEVTQLLCAIDAGDPRAAEQLLPLVYEELRRLAAHKMAGERAGHTLQATALVHEAYLRLVKKSQQQWQNRSQFIAVAAETMRRILVDRARRRLAAKRDAGEVCLDTDELDIPAPATDDQLLAVNEALEKFALQDARKAEFVKLRFFCRDDV